MSARTRTQTPTVAALAVVALAGLTACSSASTSSSSSGAASTNARAASASGTVAVLAAASLTESFDSLATSYMAANPGTTVKVTYGSSATLVQQANNGAPADIVATAGEDAAAKLDKSLVRKTVVVASNTLEIAVPPANPGKVSQLSDLASPNLKVVLCATAVPCGAAADATFTKAGVTPHVVSRETDVKATLTKVRLGEADAAVVYHSDVVSTQGGVTGITIPASVNQVLRYPVITVSDNATAASFAAYVAGPEGQKALTADGFQAP